MQDSAAPQHPESSEQLSDDSGRFDSDEDTPPHDAIPDDDVEDSEDSDEHLEKRQRSLSHR